MNAKSRLSLLIALLLIVLCLASAARATTDKVLGRGIDPQLSYHIGEVDSVNLYSGNLTANVPLGTHYQTNGTLAYQFGLTYNSRVLDYLEVMGIDQAFYMNFYFQLRAHIGSDADGPPANLSGPIVQSSSASTDSVTSLAGEIFTESIPTPLSNAGLGWMLSFGEIRNGRDTVEYIAPDGNVHEFWSDLHAPRAAPADPSTWYARDSSYLRLKIESPTAREVHFPDGIRKRFVCLADCTHSDGTRAQWVFDQMTDPFGNVLYVKRFPNARPATGAMWVWEYHEATRGSVGGPVADYVRPEERTGLTHARKHTASYLVRFNHELRIEQLSLASPSGDANAQNYATYRFHYREPGIHRFPGSIWVASPQRIPMVDLPTDPAVPGSPLEKRQAASVLSRIEFPVADGHGRKMEWKFEYIENPTDRQHYDDGRGNVFDMSYTSGLLKKVVKPTGGAIAYDYSVANFYGVTCDEYLDRQTGARLSAVSAKRILDQNGAVEGEWKYLRLSDQKTPRQGRTDCNLPRELVVFVVDPFYNTTANYFSIYLDGSKEYFAGQPKPWDAAEFGMGFSKAQTDGTGFISSETFRCKAADFDTADPTAYRARLRQMVPHLRAAGEPATCGFPFRSNYAKFRHSGADSDGPAASIRQVNLHLTYAKTVFAQTDPGSAKLNVALAAEDSWQSDTFSDYDGLGNFRTSVSNGNFYQKNFPNGTHPPGNSKTLFVNFNPGVQFSEATLSFTQGGFPTGIATWLLNLYDSSSVQETGATETAGAASSKHVTEYQFNTWTGLLQKRRVLASCIAKSGEPQCTGRAVRGPFDTLVVYERETMPDALEVFVRERYFGGDLQNIGVNDLALTNPATPEYELHHIYRAGGVRWSAYVCPGSPKGTAALMPLQTSVIDQESGFALQTTDASGIVSTYRYDDLGRVISASRPGETPTDYFYTHAAWDAGRAPAVEVRNGSAASPQLKTFHTFDAQGRPATVQRPVPGGATTVKRYSYWGTGWLKTESVFGPSGDASKSGKTSYDVYDPFGRALLITHPAGGASTFWFGGTRYSRKVMSGVAAAGGSSTLHHYFDRHGRLVRVDEQPNANTTYTTAYEYDSADRLIKVVADNAGTAEKQTRTSTYDHRGYLRNDWYPEVGGQGVSYREYDSRGHVGKRYLTNPSNARGPFDVAFDYDAVERVTSVSLLSPSRVLKSYSYYPASAAAGAQHRLQRATRANRVPNPASATSDIDVSVSTRYVYDGLGRVIEKDLSSGGVAGAIRHRPTFGYDTVGNMGTVKYPTLRANGVTYGSNRNVFSAFSYGFLTATSTASEQIASLTYHPNGFVNRVTHGNGVEDVYEIETSNHMPRPKRIWTDKVNGAGFNSGVMAYDARGSITAIGTHTYTYDGLGRLLGANMGAYNQAYTYDRYGNITSWPSVTVNSANNQLAAGATYDAAGNLKTWADPRRGVAGYTYRYDPFNMLVHIDGPDVKKVFVYDADDERAAIFDYFTSSAGVKETWSVRDLSRNVIRDFEYSGGTWKWTRDYIRRGRTLLSVISRVGTSEETRHVHTDHLGSPRLMTGMDRVPKDTERRTFYPFGQEIQAKAQTSRLQFTGHERDDDGSVNVWPDLDYMHARHYNAMLGRFLSPDRLQGVRANPQSWNRYSYVRNDPMGFSDPLGMWGLAGWIEQVLGGIKHEHDPADPEFGQDLPHVEDSITVVDANPPTAWSIIGDTVDGVAFDMAGRTYMDLRDGIINNDGKSLAWGVGQIGLSAMAELGMVRYLGPAVSRLAGRFADDLPKVALIGRGMKTNVNPATSFYRALGYDTEIYVASQSALGNTASLMVEDLGWTMAQGQAGRIFVNMGDPAGLGYSMFLEAEVDLIMRMGFTLQ